MNIFPAIKSVNEKLNEMYLRVVNIEEEIKEKLNNKNPPEEYNFEFFLSDLHDYTSKYRDVLGRCLKKFEEETKSVIKIKIIQIVNDKKKVNSIQNKLTQYPLSFNINSNLIRSSINKEDLTQIKENINEKYHIIIEKIKQKSSLKNKSSFIEKSGNTNKSNILLQMNETELEQTQSYKTTNQNLDENFDNHTQGKKFIDQNKNKVELKKSTSKFDKKPDRTDEPEQIDYEKLMKRDELRKKLEARKKISINKSKIDKDLEDARRK